MCIVYVGLIRCMIIVGCECTVKNHLCGNCLHDKCFCAANFPVESICVRSVCKHFVWCENFERNVHLG